MKNFSEKLEKKALTNALGDGILGKLAAEVSPSERTQVREEEEKARRQRRNPRAPPSERKLARKRRKRGDNAATPALLRASESSRGRGGTAERYGSFRGKPKAGRGNGMSEADADEMYLVN